MRGAVADAAKNEAAKRRDTYWLVYKHGPTTCSLSMSGAQYATIVETNEWPVNAVRCKLRRACYES